jgi:cysteine desulfurase
VRARPLRDLVDLDHAATTAMRPEAIEVMLPFLRGRYGNPSGAHRLARDARQALDDARDVLAECLGCEPGELVFTSGGTEADNLAVLAAGPEPGGAPWCSAIEHHAVLEPVEACGGTLLPVDREGGLDLVALAEAMDALDRAGASPPPRVVAVMAANNETGVVQPVDEVAELVHRRWPATAVFVDAVAAFAWLDVAELTAGADLVAVSAHKFGGPKGVGALVSRRGTALRPRQVGGGQEAERRSGTQNVAGAVAMAEAARLTAADRKQAAEEVAERRDRLVQALVDVIPDVTVTAERARTTAGTAHLCFAGVESEALVVLLEEAGILTSGGSSCASGAQGPSHVLDAMGVSRELADGALRLSLGYDTTDHEVDRAVAAIPAAVDRLRAYGR